MPLCKKQKKNRYRNLGISRKRKFTINNLILSIFFNTYKSSTFLIFISIFLKKQFDFFIKIKKIFLYNKCHTINFRERNIMEIQLLVTYMKTRKTDAFKQNVNRSISFVRIPRYNQTIINLCQTELIYILRTASHYQPFSFFTL